MTVEKFFRNALMFLGIILLLVDIVWLKTYQLTKTTHMPTISGIGLLLLGLSYFFNWLHKCETSTKE